MYGLRLYHFQKVQILFGSLFGFVFGFQELLDIAYSQAQMESQHHPEKHGYIDMKIRNKAL